MSAFILVHGAWHGAWCWREVVPRLEAKGHVVRAIDLPSHGDDPADPATVGWNDYKARTADAVRALAAGGERVVLVGHSMGGGVISRAAPDVEDDLAALVFLAAFMIRPGDPEPEMGKTALSPGVRIDDETGCAHVDPAVIRDAFYHDCSDAQIALAKERLVPNPPVVVDLANPTEWADAVPRVYVECTEDRALPIAAQRQMIEQTGCAAVHTFETSHSPFFSAPAELADLFDAIANRFAGRPRGTQDGA